MNPTEQRLFVAVKLSAGTVERIAEVLERLKRGQADVKWVEPRNLHLTLKFLGNVKNDRIEEIVQALNSGRELGLPFDLWAAGTGTFPGGGNPRVIWVGVARGSTELTELASTVEKRLVRAGYEREKKRFSPHITIGRVRSPRGIGEVVSILESYKQSVFGRTRVADIELVSSTLTASGPIYRTLASIPVCPGAETNGARTNGGGSD